MCLSVSSVWAQNATTTTKKVQSIASDATPAAELGTGYYLIKIQFKPNGSNSSKSAYVYYNGNDVNGTDGSMIRANDESSISRDTISSSGSLAYVWHVSKLTDGAGNNTLTIQCAGNGGFFPKQDGRAGNMNVSKNSANFATYYYSDVKTYIDEQTSSEMSGVLLYQSNFKFSDGSSYYVHANESSAPYLLNYWNGGSAGGTACLFSFYKITLAADVETSANTVLFSEYKQQVNGEYTGITTTKCVVAGSAATNPWTVYSDGVLEAQCSPSTIAADTKTIDVNFVKKTSPAIDLDTYHRLNIGRSTQLAATKNGNIFTKYCTKNFLANYYSSYWKFVQDGLQVKMVNCDGKYLKLESVPTTNDGKGTVQYVDNASDATNLYLCEKSSNSASTGNGRFILKVGDPSNNVAIGDHQDNNLCAWKNSGAFTDEGSCFVVADNAGFSVETASILSARIMNDQKKETEISNNILRVADTESLNLAHSALSKLGENTIPGALIDAYNLAYKAKIDENAYYRIKNQGTSSNEATAKRYPSSEAIVTNTEGDLQADATRTITRKTASDNMVAQLWQFKDAGDGNYFIQNANTGCRWAAPFDRYGNMVDIDMPTMVNSGDAGHYSIDAIPVGGQKFSEGLINNVNDGKSKFFITLHLKGQHVINAFKGLNNENLKEDASNATPCNDAGNYWQIEKVENFDVAITGARYATVGYPFPVQVTNNDVKVYYATEAKNGVLKLTEATDNIIPANEGAILYCESSPTTANMKILAPTESTTFTDNKLTATTAKRDGFKTLTTYGLSKVNDVVCFRLNKSTDVPANKAYLDASRYTSASGSAQQLLFSFDNVVEGIDNVVKAQNANKVYYDLQGRRVLYPAHGIFVTENGEKVFIK